LPALNFRSHRDLTEFFNSLLEPETMIFLIGIMISFSVAHAKCTCGAWLRGRGVHTGLRPRP